MSKSNFTAAGFVQDFPVGKYVFGVQKSSFQMQSKEVSGSSNLLQAENYLYFCFFKPISRQQLCLSQEKVLSSITGQHFSLS